MKEASVPEKAQQSDRSGKSEVRGDVTVLAANKKLDCGEM
jgi:hypothetical protein